MMLDPVTLTVADARRVLALVRREIESNRREIANIDADPGRTPEGREALAAVKVARGALLEDARECEAALVRALDEAAGAPGRLT